MCFIIHTYSLCSHAHALCLQLDLRTLIVMAVRERKFFVGGNWKMNGNKASIDSIIEFLIKGPLSSDSGGC